MSIYDEINDPVFTHMLGYLKPKQWADSLTNETFYKIDIINLIIEQEKRYAFFLMTDVLDEVQKTKGISYRNLIDTRYKEAVFERQDKGEDVEVRT